MTPPTPAKKRIDIERVGQMDLTVLASDRGAVPMNIGAVLEFDEPAVPTGHHAKPSGGESSGVPRSPSGCTGHLLDAGGRSGSTIRTSALTTT